jgi:diacylglycerol O-acyltransferase
LADPSGLPTNAYARWIKHNDSQVANEGVVADVARLALPEDLTALDELLLKGDAWPTTRPIMTMALLLSRTPAAGRLEAAFEKAIHTVPRMRQRVARSVWTFGRASWVDVDEFELSYHLRRIGAPGDGSFDAALDWASGDATAPFDPSRPLWDATLVERLADGRALVVIRAHHSIADGVRAIQMMAALLDLEASPPHDAATGGAEKPPTVLSPNTAQIFRAIGRTWVTNPAQAAGFARSASRASLRPAHALADTTAYVRSALRTVDRGDATPSALLSGRSNSRHFATLEVPLDTIKATAKTNGATVNDVYLTGLIGGLRKYHQAFALVPTDIALALPIDVAGDSEHQAGNHISAAIIPGPASVEDPVARLRIVHELVASRRAEPGLSALDHLAPTIRQVPARAAIAAMGVHARRVELQASNLVGPPFPVYLAGQQVDRMYAFGPLPRVPAMAVLVSYEGVCTIGLTLDPAAITDIGLFLNCVRDSFKELLGEDILGGPDQLRPPSPPRTSYRPPEGAP